MAHCLECRNLLWCHCALPCISKTDCLRSSFDSRLRGRCIACVPRSPGVTRNPVDRLVRLGLAVSDCGYVGRPSPMAGETCSGGGEVYCHRRWCPPCQPPNVCWLAVYESCPVRLAAHPLNIPPRGALRGLFVSDDLACGPDENFPLRIPNRDTAGGRGSPPLHRLGNYPLLRAQRPNLAASPYTKF